MKFVSRAEAGLRSPRHRTGLNPSGGVTIHWEGPTMGSFPHSSCASKVRGIQNYHMDAKGWSDAAYTCIVCPHGYVYELRWLGVRTGANGTNSGNASWYAVCALVGVNDPHPQVMLDAIHEVCQYLRDVGRAGPEVNGHRNHKSTMCPGPDLYAIVESDRFQTNPGVSPPAPNEGELTMEPEVKAAFDKLTADVGAVRTAQQKHIDENRQQYGSLRGWIASFAYYAAEKLGTSFKYLRNKAGEEDTYRNPIGDRS